MQAIGSFIGSVFNTPIGHFVVAASKVVMIGLGALAALGAYLRYRRQHSNHDLKNKRIDIPKTTPKTSQPVKEVAASILDNAPKVTTQPLEHTTRDRAGIPAGKRKPPTRKPKADAPKSASITE